MSESNSLQDHFMETLSALRNEVELKVGIAIGLAGLAEDECAIVEVCGPKWRQAKSPATASRMRPGV